MAQPFISGNFKYIQAIVLSLVEIGTLALKKKMKSVKRLLPGRTTDLEGGYLYNVIWYFL